MLIRRASFIGPADRCAIAVMAKASIVGRTKTRLVPPLSFEQAAELNTAFLADITENLRLADRKIDIATYLAFGPLDSTPFFKQNFEEDIGLIEAWFANFGDCLYQAVDTLLSIGYSAACVLNSDSPTLPTEFLIETARLLARPGDRAVLGPSIDGGYYILGLKRKHRRMFQDIAWSTQHVMRETLERAAEIGLEVEILPTWYDVDDAESLTTLMGETLYNRPFSHQACSYAAAHSAAAMRKLAMQLVHLTPQAEA